VLRVLRKSIILEPEKAQLIVMTIACLHNFLRSPDSAEIYTAQARLIVKKMVE
jgi:hypothetical protein